MGEKWNMFSFIKAENVKVMFEVDKWLFHKWAHHQMGRSSKLKNNQLYDPGWKWEEVGREADCQSWLYSFITFGFSPQFWKLVWERTSLPAWSLLYENCRAILNAHCVSRRWRRTIRIYWSQSLTQTLRY